MENHEVHDKLAKEKIVSNIKNYDCHLALIEGDGYLPSFVYTIGLYEKFQHPEIMIFGLKTDVMGDLLNGLRDEIKTGKSYMPNIEYPGFLEGYNIQFLEVKEEYYPDYLGYAGWYYKMTFDFPVLQMIWPDKENNWPWENAFNEAWKFKQPLLDRNIDFKYREERNLGVFTTYHALEGKPILYVHHNEDGDWQFHTEYEPKLEDSKLVCLEEIIKLDPTLNEVYYLNYGQTAYRNAIGGEWTIEQAETEDEKPNEKTVEKSTFWTKLKSKWF